jgi:NAD(P)-dependent dehydrogenase (short-subunit alcohol dehydrogenase family)
VIVENQLKVPRLGKNMKTIFITGASSGLGKATTKLFSAKGWNVIATMRTPAKEKELRSLLGKAHMVMNCDGEEK